LAEYLEKHRDRIKTAPAFAYSSRQSTPDERRRMIEQLDKTDGYVLGGRSAELRGLGGTPRTDS
jgi:hypothetical protein